MARELKGKVAVVTGAASGIELASAEAALRDKHGDAVIPLTIDLLDPKGWATLLPRVLEGAGRPDLLRIGAVIRCIQHLVGKIGSACGIEIIVAPERKASIA